MNINLNKIEDLNNTVKSFNNGTGKNSKLKYFVILLIIIVGAVIIQQVKDKSSEKWPTVEALITDTREEDKGEDSDRKYCYIYIEFTYNNEKSRASVEADDSYCFPTSDYEGKYIKVRVNPKKDIFGHYSRVYIHDWTTYQK